jgi:hypothetical protein
VIQRYTRSRYEFSRRFLFSTLNGDTLPCPADGRPLPARPLTGLPCGRTARPLDTGEAVSSDARHGLRLDGPCGDGRSSGRAWPLAGVAIGRGPTHMALAGEARPQASLKT